MCRERRLPTEIAHPKVAVMLSPRNGFPLASPTPFPYCSRKRCACAQSSWMSESSHLGAAAGAPPPHDSDAGAEALEGSASGFPPVPVRYRYDGWLPDKQTDFIERLADCGCVEEAARSVGMSRNSAYALRRRIDAQAFRLAWDAAMDAAVARLNDAAMARAINGVAVPIFHGAEQVGERRHFDERLTMLLLRYRNPTRYGKWQDRMESRQHSEGPVMILVHRLARLMRAAYTAFDAAFDAAFDGKPPPDPEREIVEPHPIPFH